MNGGEEDIEWVIIHSPKVIYPAFNLILVLGLPERSMNGTFGPLGQPEHLNMNLDKKFL